MNQNDMDRYYWRRGYPWSGDSRSLREIRGEGRPVAHRTRWLLLIVLLITLLMLARV
jgi:hypothetical protein